MTANWCANTLTIKGTRSELTRFKKSSQGRTIPSPLDGRKRLKTPLSFQSLFPEPAETELHSYSDGELPGWYLWREQNWGTSWDIGPGTLNVKKDSARTLVWEFETVEAPPIGVFSRVSRLYPNLEFHLKFEGAKSAGERLF